MRVVELPVNASEDRVVGTIDTEAAIKLGERRFEPGLLADANRGILYVDEVNLLDDHIVDVLLDAAAMGWNVVEREGISFSHPSRFILVGTMNPEEGDLRPQLLDRFGLCVDITGLRDVDERVRIMERDAQRSRRRRRSRQRVPRQRGPPQGGHRGGEAAAAARGDHADDRLVHRAGVHRRRRARPPRRHRGEQRRADGPRVGRGGAGWCAPGRRGWPPKPDERLVVTTADATTAAELALAHRRRSRQDGVAQPAGAAAERARERFEEIAQEAEAAVVSEQTSEAGDQPPDDSGSGEEGESPGQVQGSEQATQAVTRRSAEQLFEGEIFPVRKIALPRDRRSRSTTGKRSSSQSSDKRGPLRPRDADREDDRHRLRRHHARRRAAPGPPPCRRARRTGSGRRCTWSARTSARRSAAGAPAR